ncbi:MAG: choice-of-anchor Q domain-containing protein, partial [Bacteroidota bacterium]
FGDGGAVYIVTSNLNVDNCRFTNNQVVNNEPAGSSDETGGGAIFVDGAQFRNDDGEVFILNSLFENNQAISTTGRFTQGGAMFLFAYNNNRFVVDGCTIRNNRSNTFGGGININGGILNDATYNASFTVRNCTLDSNFVGGQGGGIWASGTSRNRGNPRILIENVTFHQNESEEFGAGMVNLFVGLTLNNCTFAFNRSQKTGGAIFNGTNSGATMSINNSIFYANESIENPPSNHCSANLSGGNNLQFPIVNNERFCAPGNVSLDPLLGSLQDNGGPVPTMALQNGSPAIDAGNSACVRSDARGLFRNGACDLGAFELNGLDTDPNPQGEDLQVFNILSPNGDGQNDFWQIITFQSF